MSAKMYKAQKYCMATELECYAAKLSVEKFRSYSSISEDQKTWGVHLSDTAFSLRSAIHILVGMTPYYALFGFKHNTEWVMSQSNAKIKYFKTL